MKKKLKKNIELWQLHTFNILLPFLIEQYADDGGDCGNNTADGSNNSPNVRHASTSGSCLQTSFVDDDTTTAGYLVAIWHLLKQALFHKKGVHFFLVGWRNPAADFV